MKIAISAETTVDVQSDLLAKYNIHTVPYSVTLGEKDFKDGEISTEEIFDYVDETNILPKTNAVNRFQYEEYFKSLLNEYDAVIHVCLSSCISSACENAKAVASELKNVYIIDSRSLSTGIALLCIYASELTKTVDDPKAICSLVNDRIESLQVSFVVDRLDYLYLGGRCSGIANFFAGVLKIHPRIVLKNGNMINDRKYMGNNMDRVVGSYVKDTLKDFANPDKSVVFITYTSATKEMVNETKEALLAQGFENIYETHANCTVASHCGPKTLGILYFNDGDKITTIKK